MLANGKAIKLAVNDVTIPPLLVHENEIEYKFNALSVTLPGGMLGSSQRLREELIEVAPKLGISINQTSVSDSEVARLNQIAVGEDEAMFFRECCVWLALFEACRVSIECRTAICFR